MQVQEIPETGVLQEVASTSYSGCLAVAVAVNTLEFVLGRPIWSISCLGFEAHRFRPLLAAPPPPGFAPPPSRASILGGLVAFSLHGAFFCRALAVGPMFRFKVSLRVGSVPGGKLGNAYKAVLVGVCVVEFALHGGQRSEDRDEAAQDSEP